MKKKWSIAFGVGATVALASIGFFHWANQPQVTSVKVQPNVKGAETPDYSTKSYKNIYLEMQIPTRFSEKLGAGTPHPPIVIQQLFSAPSNSGLYADQLALTIGRLPPNGLQELSAVQLRTRTATYTQLTAMWLPTSTTIAFEGSEGGYELSVFVAHDTKYAAFVFSGLSDKKVQLQHEMQLMMASLIWPKS